MGDNSTAAGCNSRKRVDERGRNGRERGMADVRRGKCRR